MVNMKQRYQEIIKLLIDNENTLAVTTICSELEVSIKTLKNDIKEMNNLLEPFLTTISIEKNEVYFQTDHPQSYWLNVLTLNKQLSTAQRLKSELLLSNVFLTSYDLACICYTSKSNIEKIINSLSWKFCKLKPVRNRGYIIEGTNWQKIQELWDLFYCYIDPLNYQITTKIILNKCIKMDNEKYQKSVIKHNQFIAEYQIKNNRQIMLHFLITLLAEHNEYFMLSVEQEIMIFTINSEVKAKEKIEMIIRTFFKNNNISNVDKQTYNLLVNHLLMMLKRDYITNNYQLSSKLEEIKFRFNYAYILAINLLKEFEMQMQIKIKEIEVLYVTIYIQTIINKDLVMVRPQVIIVSEYSDSISNYLEVRIQEQLSNKYIVKAIPLVDFKSYKITNEIVISTLKNIEDINYLQINPLPSDEDIFRSIKFIKNREIFQQFDELFKLNIKRTISKNLLLTQIKEDLATYHLAAPDYLATVVKRYQQQLAVVNNIIVLHGDANKVYKNQIIVYNLTDAFKYGDSEVKVIILLILNQNSIEYFSDISKNIYRLIYHHDFANAISSDMSLPKINWYLKRNYQL